MGNDQQFDSGPQRRDAEQPERRESAGTGQQSGRDEHEPAGFTSRTSGSASEHAREQGWDLNEEQRTQTPMEKQPYDGGRDYDYGARDFGDSAVDTSSAQPAPDALDRLESK